MPEPDERFISAPVKGSMNGGEVEKRLFFLPFSAQEPIFGV